MDKNTAEIIMVLKGNSWLKDDFSYRDKVAKYMADKCACPVFEYSDEHILSILQTCLMNFAEDYENPRYLWWLFFDNLSFAKSIERFKTESTQMIHAIASTLVMSNVKDSNHKYINGFTEENTSFVKKSYEENK